MLKKQIQKSINNFSETDWTLSFTETLNGAFLILRFNDFIFDFLRFIEKSQFERLKRIYGPFIFFYIDTIRERNKTILWKLWSKIN